MADGGWRAAAMILGLLATLRTMAYRFVARRRRFTYSQSRFVIPDGGMGAPPNTDSSVSEHPLKLTAYPPNGTFFTGLVLPFGLAFAIVSSLRVSGGMILLVRLRSLRTPRRLRARAATVPAGIPMPREPRSTDTPLPAASLGRLL